MIVLLNELNTFFLKMKNEKCFEKFEKYDVNMQIVSSSLTFLSKIFLMHL